MECIFLYESSGDTNYLEEALFYIARITGGEDRLKALATLFDGVAKVLTFGAKKYADHNWTKGIKISRNIAASKRHLNNIMLGEQTDPESGIDHFFHAACDIMFILETLDSCIAKDYNDRFRWEDWNREPSEN
jgi:hypothetical protein